jgi:RNA polymerase primary sigma factor
MRPLKIFQGITNRDTFSLQKYLHEVSRLETISPKEEEELTQKIKEGDYSAMQKLVKANLRFVISVAKQYQYKGLPLSDLINEGNIGLIKAAQRFDETRGFKFISYAVWWIRQNIIQAIAEHGKLIRLPMNKFNLNLRLKTAYEQLEQTFEREPTICEMADLLKLNEREINDVMNINRQYISMDAPFSDAEETLCDTMENPDAEIADRGLHYESLKKDIQSILSILSDRQKEIICALYGIGLEQPSSLEDLGHKFNLTRERVRQIRDKALKKIKLHRTGKCLCCYLG